MVFSTDTNNSRTRSHSNKVQQRSGIQPNSNTAGIERRLAAINETAQINGKQSNIINRFMESMRQLIIGKAQISDTQQNLIFTLMERYNYAEHSREFIEFLMGKIAFDDLPQNEKISNIDISYLCEACGCGFSQKQYISKNIADYMKQILGTGIYDFGFYKKYTEPEQKSKEKLKYFQNRCRLKPLQNAAKNYNDNKNNPKSENFKSAKKTIEDELPKALLEAYMPGGVFHEKIEGLLDNLKSYSQELDQPISKSYIHYITDKNFDTEKYLDFVDDPYRKDVFEQITDAKYLDISSDGRLINITIPNYKNIKNEQIGLCGRDSATGELRGQILIKEFEKFLISNPNSNFYIFLTEKREATKQNFLQDFKINNAFVTTLNMMEQNLEILMNHPKQRDVTNSIEVLNKIKTQLMEPEVLKDFINNKTIQKKFLVLIADNFFEKTRAELA